jgi:hypothetical protein
MNTVPIKAPLKPIGTTTADQVATGLPVPPIERIRLMSNQQWEEFVLEWVDSLKQTYPRVERHGGAGDKGCDVVAFLDAGKIDPWDNYQCKHYDHPLSPSDLWKELGKYTYYTFVGEYAPARKYVFVAPHGVSTSTSKLLRNEAKLKAELSANWSKHCENKITALNSTPLDAALQTHLDKLDFKIFSGASPLTIIKEHAETVWHVHRFGGGLPARSKAPSPPANVTTHEANYVRALLDAYEARLGVTLATCADLNDLDLLGHFGRARQEFYSAEALREFSRDNVPLGTFEDLLDEVYDGVIDVIESQHPDAVERVLACVQQAKALTFSNLALGSRVVMADKGGMCHQLANNQRIKWRI